MAPPPEPGKDRHQVWVKTERVRVEVSPGHIALEGESIMELYHGTREQKLVGFTAERALGQESVLALSGGDWGGMQKKGSGSDEPLP